MNFNKKYFKNRNFKKQFGGIFLPNISNILIETNFGNTFKISSINEFDRIINITKNLGFSKRKSIWAEALHKGGNIMSNEGLIHIFKYGILSWYKNYNNIIYNLTDEKNESTELLYKLSKLDLTHLSEGYMKSRNNRKTEENKLRSNFISLKQFMKHKELYDEYVRLIEIHRDFFNFCNLIDSYILNMVDNTSPCFNINIYRIGIAFNRLKIILEKMQYYGYKDSKFISERDKSIKTQYATYLKTKENEIKNTKTLHKLDKLLDIFQSIIYFHLNYLKDLKNVVELYNYFLEKIKNNTKEREELKKDIICEYLKKNPPFYDENEYVILTSELLKNSNKNTLINPISDENIYLYELPSEIDKIL